MPPSSVGGKREPLRPPAVIFKVIPHDAHPVSRTLPMSNEGSAFILLFRIYILIFGAMLVIFGAMLDSKVDLFTNSILMDGVEYHQVRPRTTRSLRLSDLHEVPASPPISSGESVRGRISISTKKRIIRSSLSSSVNSTEELFFTTRVFVNLPVDRSGAPHVVYSKETRCNHLRIFLHMLRYIIDCVCVTNRSRGRGNLNHVRIAC